MPIYEYLCNSCGHEFEQFQKITSDPADSCPSCGDHKVTRLISRTSFQLKGSGWYVTDYKKGSSSSSSDYKPSASDSKTSATGSSDTKPAKSETKSEAASTKKD